MHRHAQHGQHPRDTSPPHACDGTGAARSGRKIPARLRAVRPGRPSSLPLASQAKIAAAHQALQVNHPVEGLLPHPRRCCARSPASAGAQPSAGARKRTTPARSGSPSSNGARLRVNPPVDLARGQVPLEQAQHRQRLHHVAQRTGFEDEDFHAEAEFGAPALARTAALQANASWQRRRYRPNASRSASRGGRPASRIFFCAAAMSYSSRRSSMVPSSTS